MKNKGLDHNDSKCCSSPCGCSDEKEKQIDQEEDCGCGASEGCCSGDSSHNLLTIDFLYLDLSVCTRCQDTESTLENSLEDISALLKEAGYEVVLNKIHIDSIEKAIQNQFISSPTIRLNGVDIISKTEESNCKDCGDLCGNEVDCRDWVFEGKRFTEPPKQMLIQAILKEIYVPSSEQSSNSQYAVPENIKRFFEYK